MVVGPGGKPTPLPPLTETDREQMLAKVTDLATSDSANAYWKPPTTYMYSLGDYHSGPRTYQIKAYWRDGMCDLAHVDGRCPSAPGEALIDPLMLQTIQGKVGDQIQVIYTGYAGNDKPVKEVKVAYTIVGTASDMEEVTRSEVIKYSAGGFRDFTRIAASDPTMWRDVFLTNREAVLEMLQRFSEDLTALQRAIRIGDGDQLHDHFTRTRAIRRSIVDQGQDDAAPDFGRTHD